MKMQLKSFPKNHDGNKWASYTLWHAFHHLEIRAVYVNMSLAIATTNSWGDREIIVLMSNKCTDPSHKYTYVHTPTQPTLKTPDIERVRPDV